MNKKEVERLWLVANKVRGAFEITELCRVMIYALFLKYIELVDENFDEKFSVGYLSLTYGKMVRSGELSKYIAEIERKIGIDEYIISDELERLLRKADDSSIRIIFEAVNEIMFENSEELYEVARWLLDKVTIYGGRVSAEGGTNLSLCKLEASLLNCQEGMKVYDGFCGNGLSINEVSAKKGIVYMQDVNVSSLSVAIVITLLRGNRIGAIKCGDSFLNPLSDEKYDRIVCEPPFGIKYQTDYFWSIPRENFILADSIESESLALRQTLAHLKMDGIATVLVNMGMLFRSGRVAGIRKHIACNYIDAIIEFPGGLLSGTNIPVALMVLKMNKLDQNIYMINAKEFCEKGDNRGKLLLKDENIDKIVALYNNKETVEGISRNVSIDEIAQNEFNLCTTQYVLVSPENTIVVENTAEYIDKYATLMSELIEIDEKLSVIRNRWS